MLKNTLLSTSLRHASHQHSELFLSPFGVHSYSEPEWVCIFSRDTREPVFSLYGEVMKGTFSNYAYEQAKPNSVRYIL